MKARGPGPVGDYCRMPTGMIPGVSPSMIDLIHGIG